MSVEEFVTLNPAHNRPVIAASRNNQLKIPADRQQSFMAAVERHENAKLVFASWQPYTLKPGETLDTVAQRGGVQTFELRKANSLRDGQRIVAGTRILAPQASVEDEQKVEQFVAPRVYEQVERPPVYHTVGRAESAPTIAQRYGISTATLAAWNGIKRGVKRGMRLLVQPASTQTLLTNEEGERSVVNTAQHATGVLKVAADEPAQKDPALAPAPQARSLPTAASVAKTIEASGGRTARPAVQTGAASGRRAEREDPVEAVRHTAQKGGTRVSAVLKQTDATRKAAEPQRKTANANRSPAPVRSPIRISQDQRFGRR
jgi:membrane-bound lytic murein transglycosylase D